MENVRVRKAGYAHRMPQKAFVQRYRITCPATWPRWRFVHPAFISPCRSLALNVSQCRLRVPLWISLSGCDYVWCDCVGCNCAVARMAMTSRAKFGPSSRTSSSSRFAISHTVSCQKPYPMLFGHSANHVSVVSCWAGPHVCRPMTTPASM